MVRGVVVVVANWQTEVFLKFTAECSFFVNSFAVAVANKAKTGNSILRDTNFFPDTSNLII